MVFRSMPLAVSLIFRLSSEFHTLLDSEFHATLVLIIRSPLPSLKVFGSLLVILSGAIAYVLFDSEFSIRSYLWASAYVVAMTIDMVLIKKIVTDVG